MKPQRRAAAACLPLLLAACGGGGGGGINPDVAGVTGSSTATPRFGQDLVITLDGRNLGKPINVSTLFSTCLSLVRSTAEPYVSSDTRAYYICATPSVTAQAQRVLFERPSDGVLLADVSFSVPEPQVTVSVSNGAGVSGSFTVALEARKAPATVYNFLKYVNAGFYTDTVFHREVPGAFIQGGGYARELVPGGATLPTLKSTEAPIALEDNAGLSNLAGTLAMARTSVLNSATSQFFINLADNTYLDRSATQRGYAVFGSVSAGADFVTAMAAAPCSAWPEFFGAGDAAACLPAPNLVITGIVQTR